jgi:hypothetical protein
MDDQQDGGLIEAVAELIRDVDGSHELGAAALAEALVHRGVTLRARGEQRVYAVATKPRDGNARAMSESFTTLDAAMHELAVMRGDDYYLDQHPFIATCVETPWVPVDEDVLVASGFRVPPVTVVNPTAIGDPDVAPILCLGPDAAELIHQASRDPD